MCSCKMAHEEPPLIKRTPACLRMIEQVVAYGVDAHDIGRESSSKLGQHAHPAPELNATASIQDPRRLAKRRAQRAMLLGIVTNAIVTVRILKIPNQVRASNAECAPHLLRVAVGAWHELMLVAMRAPLAVVYTHSHMNRQKRP